MSDVPAGQEPGDDLDLGPIDDIEPDQLEPEEGQEPPEPEAAEPEPQQRRTRVPEAQRWRQRYEESERRYTDLERRIEDIRRQPQPAYDPSAQQRQQEAMFQRWNEIAPADAIREALQYGEQRTQQQLLLIQMQTNDRIDRQAYEAEVQRGSRLHQHYSADVERVLNAERQRGNLNISRTDILDQLIGRDARLRSARAAPGARRQAAGRIARETTTPGNARGDVARTTGRTTSQDDADVALLKGIGPRDV